MEYINQICTHFSQHLKSLILGALPYNIFLFGRSYTFLPVLKVHQRAQSIKHKINTIEPFFNIVNKVFGILKRDSTPSYLYEYIFFSKVTKY